MHGEDIVSMAIHPDGEIVATGQMAGKELNGPASNSRNMDGAKGRKALADGKLVDILIWNSTTMQLVQKITGFHRRAVRHLKFSPNGRYLMSIGEDDQNSVAIYDWAQAAMVANAKVTQGKLNDPNAKIEQAKIFDCNWKDDTMFAACGPDFVKQFTLNGSNLNQTQAQMSAIGFIPQTSCAYVLTGFMVTGGSDGKLLQWKGAAANKPIDAHTGAVWQIVPQGTSAFFTGGEDGLIVKWSSSFAKTATIDLKTACPIKPGIRSLCLAKEGHLLVGTIGA